MSRPGDRMTKLFHGLCVVGDANPLFGDAAVGADDQFAGEDLWRLHGPKPGAIERFQVPGLVMLFDRIGDTMGKDHRMLPPDDLVQGHQLFRAHQRSRAVVDKNVVDVIRSR